MYIDTRKQTDLLCVATLSLEVHADASVTVISLVFTAINMACCIGAGGRRESSCVNGRDSVSSSPPRLDFSLGYVPRTALAEMSARSSGSSADTLDKTLSTAILDTDIQFLNDSIAVDSKPVTSRAARVRTHRVNVTVPTDTRNDAAGTRAPRKSRVTFQDIRNRDVGPSASSAVGTMSNVVIDRAQNDSVLPSADKGEKSV